MNVIINMLAVNLIDLEIHAYQKKKRLDTPNHNSLGLVYNDC